MSTHVTDRPLTPRTDIAAIFDAAIAQAPANAHAFFVAAPVAAARKLFSALASPFRKITGVSAGYRADNERTDARRAAMLAYSAPVYVQGPAAREVAERAEHEREAAAFEEALLRPKTAPRVEYNPTATVIIAAAAPGVSQDASGGRETAGEVIIVREPVACVPEAFLTVAAEECVATAANAPVAEAEAPARKRAPRKAAVTDRPPSLAELRGLAPGARVTAGGRAAAYSRAAGIEVSPGRVVWYAFVRLGRSTRELQYALSELRLMPSS